VEVQTVDLRNAEDAASLVDGVGAIVHLAAFSADAFPQALGEAEQLDAATQGTYTLMTAARESGVRRTIVASRLSMFEAYPKRWQIDEGWRPRPQTTVDDLIPFLCERVCREFAREEGEVIVLRFGNLGVETSEATAAKALTEALSVPIRDGRRYELAHVADDADRYGGRALRRMLDPSWQRRR
jgi:nucleoside-diphosphate-sugar epimerase